jgi:hypothetical protein
MEASSSRGGVHHFEVGGAMLMSGPSSLRRRAVLEVEALSPTWGRRLQNGAAALRATVPSLRQMSRFEVRAIVLLEVVVLSWRWGVVIGARAPRSS